VDARILGAFILVMLVVVVLVYFLVSNNKVNTYLKVSNVTPNTPKVFVNNTTTLSNSILANKTKPSLNISKNYSNSTKIIKPACLPSNASIIYIPNGNFSTGTYEYWNTTGTGFGDAPLNLTQANKEGEYYEKPWSGYGNTNFAGGTFRGGFAIAPGNLTSSPFLVNDSYLNFKLISPYNYQIYIELLENQTPVLRAYFNTYNASGNINAQTTFVNASLPISEFMCHKLRIRIVAGYVGAGITQYIMATDFYLSNKEITTPGILYQLNFSANQ